MDTMTYSISQLLIFKNCQHFIDNVGPIALAHFFMNALIAKHCSLLVFDCYVDQCSITQFRLVHSKAEKDLLCTIQCIYKPAPGLDKYAYLTAGLLLGLLYCIDQLLLFLFGKKLCFLLPGKSHFLVVES